MVDWGQAVCCSLCWSSSHVESWCHGSSTMVCICTSPLYVLQTYLDSLNYGVTNVIAREDVAAAVLFIGGSAVNAATGQVGAHTLVVAAPDTADPDASSTAFCCPQSTATKSQEIRGVVLPGGVSCTSYSMLGMTLHCIVQESGPQYWLCTALLRCAHAIPWSCQWY
jgi:hypothetical protein